ncbi:XFP-like protein [Prauserella shujinwangii]|uniref:XFP-like protein n=1 Tax=Prauserella shujinwangii TaxID=1453103 RepID=A0A2T0LPM4_9PSEU|nr:hypothetical protein [Prauserella shujinwangii]PRX45202.1 XFP-like protein [Prauserella shujinwangii]
MTLDSPAAHRPPFPSAHPAPTVEPERVDAWWRAANYLSAGQIYLLDNSLLRESLAPEHVKPRLLGHGGTVPGITLTYAHLNRVILRTGANVLFVAGPGHGHRTVLSRLPRADLTALPRGHDWEPVEVEGDDPAAVHQAYAAALDDCFDRIADLRRPRIVLRTPKGWTGPATVDGRPVEGTWRSHRVPNPGVRQDPQRLLRLEEWPRSYRPAELFGTDGAPAAVIRDWHPHGEARRSAKPAAHGHAQRDLRLPDVRGHAVPVPTPGTRTDESTRVPGRYALDEHASHRLDAVFEVTGGVAEHHAAVRAELFAGAHFGLRLDAQRNVAAGDRLVSPGGAAVAVAVVRCAEDLELARQAEGVLRGEHTGARA